MKRRLVLETVAAVAASRPLTGLAQRQSLPVIGFLSGVSSAGSADRLAGFNRGLTQAGYVDGKNVKIEYRWADGDYDRLSAMAAELARLPVAVLMATGGPRATQAAMAATSTIPIVFTMGGDPVKLGVVASLGRPGGHVTGVSFLTMELVAKRLELLRDLLPKARLFAMMVNPNSSSVGDQIRVAQAAARALNVRLQVAKAGSEAEIHAAFASLMRLKPDGLVIGTDALFGTRQQLFIAATALHGLPAIYEGRSGVLAGGLMGYGPSIPEAHAQAGVYVGRILGGAKPADLPVLQPTTFEFAVNLKTAKALGLSVPQSLLIRADEVIR